MNDPGPAKMATGTPRLAAARRRMRIAEAGMVVLGVALFGAGIGLVKAHAAGHVRHPRPLAAPPKFVQVVRQDALQGGIIAPAQAPPSAATSPS